MFDNGSELVSVEGREALNQARAVEVLDFLHDAFVRGFSPEEILDHCEEVPRVAFVPELGGELVAELRHLILVDSYV